METQYLLTYCQNSFAELIFLTAGDKTSVKTKTDPFPTVKLLSLVYCLYSACILSNSTGSDGLQKSEFQELPHVAQGRVEENEFTR